MSTQVCGKTTFAFSDAIRRATSHLQRLGLCHQIPRLPEAYPQHLSQLSEIDIVVRAKILKCHLEDTFAQNVFSVKVTRRKDISVIHITHDMLRPEMMTGIIALYADEAETHLDTFGASKQ